MSRTTKIEIADEEQFAWLEAIRNELGLTWRGMMLKGEQRLLAAEWPRKATEDTEDRE